MEPILCHQLLDLLGEAGFNCHLNISAYLSLDSLDAHLTYLTSRVTHAVVQLCRGESELLSGHRSKRLQRLDGLHLFGVVPNREDFIGAHIRGLHRSM